MIVIVHDLVLNGPSNASGLTDLPSTTATISNQELDRLLAQAKEKPDQEVFMRISHIYEKRGQMRLALKYLRHAETVADLQD